MPLYLLLNLLPAWLRSEGVSLKAIGLIALIQFSLHLEVPLVAVCLTAMCCRWGAVAAGSSSHN